MATIAGMEEQQKALQNVREILKEIKGINDFLEIQNPTSKYELSFKVEEPVEQTMQEGEKPAEPKKPKKRKHAIVFSGNPNTIKNMIRESKNEKIRILKEITDKYHIVLDEEERRIIGYQQ